MMRKKREPLTPDLTPVIDIVFILLIFFMVTSVFKKEDVALALNLPKIDSGKEITDTKSITIELSKDEIAIEGNKYTLDNYNKAIQNYASDTKIVIRIDKDVEYEKVMSLFNMLQKNKLNSFSLVAEKEK
jgi:biopolymer transport protein ExbD